MQTVLLLRRLNEPQELEETHSLVFTLQSVLGVQRIRQNAAARLGSLYMPLLHPLRNFPELVLDGSEVPLQLFQQIDRCRKLLANASRTERQNDPLTFDSRDLFFDVRPFLA